MNLNKKCILIMRYCLITCLAFLVSYILVVFVAKTPITIKIEAVAEKNIESWGTDVRIHHIRINQKEIPFQDLTFDGEWEYLDDLLIAVNPNHAVSIEFSAKDMNTLELDLQKHNGSGVVKISANNFVLKKMDLYALNWEEITYKQGLWIVNILSEGPMFLMLFIGFFLLFTFINHVLSGIRIEWENYRLLKKIVLPEAVLLVGSMFYGQLITGIIGGLSIVFLGSLLFWLSSIVKTKKNTWFLICIEFGVLLLTSVFLFVAVENINGNLDRIQCGYGIGNMGIYLTILLLFYVLSGHSGIAVGVGTMIALIYGILNYYVTLFRGTPITPGDFFVIGTAKNVVQNYRYEINWNIFFSVLLLIIWCMIVWVAMKGRPKPRIKLTVIGTLSLLLMLICIFKTDFYKPSLDLWNLNNNVKRYGVAMSLVSNVRNMRITAPENYSYETVEELYDSYLEENFGGGFTPNVIAIMNESYSDLSVLSDVIDNETYMPYYNSMDENTIKGKALASTIGGGTGNSEYEFLTGNSMAFLPGTVPYQQFIVQDAFSLATIFQNRGYSTTAIHPYYKSGYSRSRVYPYLGFEEFLDIDSFENSELSRDRFITDEESYKKVIEVFNKSRDKGQPAFIFNVTIQNHSDYSTGFYGEHTLKIPEFEGKFPDAEEYLTLMKESDEALKTLVDYFGRISEPTVIILFGDHQPNVDIQFYETMLGKTLGELSFEESQKRYIVPFFIWTNYDIEEQDDVFTSINYLSEILFRSTGIEMTPYQKFLAKLESEVPAININGYMGADGQWYGINQDSIYQSSINQYRNAQYNNIFDKKKLSDWYS